MLNLPNLEKYEVAYACDHQIGSPVLGFGQQIAEACIPHATRGSRNASSRGSHGSGDGVAFYIHRSYEPQMKYTCDAAQNAVP